MYDYITSYNDDIGVFNDIDVYDDVDVYDGDVDMVR